MKSNAILRRATWIEILQLAPDSRFAASEGNLNQRGGPDLVKVAVNLWEHG